MDNRIEVLETRIAELSAKLATKPKAKKKSKTLVACWCGCGGLTKSRFVPGHDARFHGRAKKVARGELDSQTELDRLPHDEARAEFTKHVEKELDRPEAETSDEVSMEEVEQFEKTLNEVPETVADALDAAIDNAVLESVS